MSYQPSWTKYAAALAVVAILSIAAGAAAAPAARPEPAAPGTAFVMKQVCTPIRDASGAMRTICSTQRVAIALPAASSPIVRAPPAAPSFPIPTPPVPVACGAPSAAPGAYAPAGCGAPCAINPLACIPKTCAGPANLPIAIVRACGPAR